MSGDQIVGSIPVLAVRAMDGEHVFLAQDGDFTRMVTDSGRSRFYKGSIDSFDAQQWGSYIPAQGRYQVKVPTSLTHDIPRYYLMYGSGMEKEMVVNKVLKFDNCTLYLVQDGTEVKVVSSSGDARTYSGSIDQFSAGAWNSYNDVGDSLLVKPIITRTTDLAASPKSSIIGAFQGLDPEGNIFLANGDICPVSGGNTTCFTSSVKLY
jgi:hypothetical protein